MINVLKQKLKSLVLRILSKKDPYVCVGNNALQVHRYFDDRVEVLKAVENEETAVFSDTLTQEPGFICFDGRVYDLTRDGLYRFFRLPDVSIQRIVCTGGIQSLLKMVGYLWTYGNRDDEKIGAQIRDAVHSRGIFGSCGVLSRQAASICSSFGITARIVSSITTEKWGGQDDGHTMLEIMDDAGNWFIYDPSFHYLFLLNGRPLSLLELSKNRLNDIEYRKLPGNGGHGEYSIKGFDYDFWIEARIHSEELLKQWYQRVLQVPLVLVGRNYSAPLSFIPASECQRFSFRYNLLPDEEFIRRFYPSQEIL